jgi:hypothetical protein
MNYAEQLEHKGFKILNGSLRMRVALELGESITASGPAGSFRLTAKNSQLQMESIAPHECGSDPLMLIRQY